VTRAWSLALPIVTVLVVAYSLLFAGVPRKITGARVYGGPTEGVPSLALRIECVTRDGESENPAWPGPLRVRATAKGGASVSANAQRALNGVAEVALQLAAPSREAIALDVRDDSGVVLASGNVELSAERWALRARRRGGWIRGRDQGGLVLSVAPARGAFVIGASEPLLIRVERAGNAVANARLTVSAEGAELRGATSLVTDGAGLARVDFEPRDFGPTFHAEASTDDGQRGLLETGLLVVPGGFHARGLGPKIRVEIAVPRTEAFFSVVTNGARVTGGALALAPDGGGSAATVELPSDLPHPAWFVVSSDVDQNSVAAIGWPLELGSEPAQTFDVRDALLLDGLPAAFAREQARRSRVRWLTAAFIAGAFALSVALLVLRVRAAEHDIARHLQENLEPEVIERVAPQRGLSLLVALLAIGLGFVLLALITLARAH